MAGRREEITISTDSITAGYPFEAEPPTTPTERVVVDIWCEILKLRTVDISDNFFDLGGHSRLLPRMRDRLREALGADLRLIAFFEHPTVRTLARHIDGDSRADKQDIGDRHSGLSRLELQRQARHGLITDSSESGASS
ncbi:phosphopantetheine-binding protein [Nonomuraea sp. NPDC050153]|uniref:phosphopantetheine-binding protein n=1 Tax=Nonomuraea sp. NPDC050153 TaxID=3364359 RepID=UPI0037B44F8B